MIDLQVQKQLISALLHMSLRQPICDIFSKHGLRLDIGHTSAVSGNLFIK